MRGCGCAAAAATSADSKLFVMSDGSKNRDSNNEKYDLLYMVGEYNLNAIRKLIRDNKDKKNDPFVKRIDIEELKKDILVRT